MMISVPSKGYASRKKENVPTDERSYNTDAKNAFISAA